jgi:hypothetical protein
MATHVTRCPIGCSPDPYLYSKIYGVVKRGEEEKYMELFKVAPPETKGFGSGSSPAAKGGIGIVVVMMACLMFIVVAIGGVYYFQDEIAVQFGYKDGKDMFTAWGIPTST